jgi:hypothetical protein
MAYSRNEGKSLIRSIKIRSGGSAFILSSGEVPPLGSVWFTEEEWAFTQRLASGFQRDPEAHRSFWETLLQKKREDAGYSVFNDFPDLSQAKTAAATCFAAVSAWFRDRQAERRFFESEAPSGGYLTQTNPGDWRHTEAQNNRNLNDLHTNKYHVYNWAGELIHIDIEGEEWAKKKAKTDLWTEKKKGEERRKQRK